MGLTIHFLGIRETLNVGNYHGSPLQSLRFLAAKLTGFNGDEDEFKTHYGKRDLPCMTRFPNLINFSDSDGMYVRETYLADVLPLDSRSLGNSDALLRELQDLKELSLEKIKITDTEPAGERLLYQLLDYVERENSDVGFGAIVFS